MQMFLVLKWSVFGSPLYMVKKALLLFCRKEKLQREREALLAQHQSHVARGKAEAETSRASKMKLKKQPEIRETAKSKQNLSQEELRNARTIKNREYRRAKKEREKLSKLVEVEAKKCNRKQEDKMDNINQSQIDLSNRQKEKNKNHQDRKTTEVEQTKLQPETSKATTAIQKEKIQTQKTKAPTERSKAPTEVQKEKTQTQTEKTKAQKERHTEKLHTGSENALVKRANSEREKMKNTGAKKRGIYQTKRRLLTEEEKRKNALKESIYKRNKSIEDEEYSPPKSHPNIVAQKTVPVLPKPDKKSKTTDKIKHPKPSNNLPKSKSSLVQLPLPVEPKPRGRSKKVSQVEKPLDRKSLDRPKKVSDVINVAKTSSKTTNVRSSSKTIQDLKSPVKIPTQGKI